jgi:hypothetical protein
LLICLILPLRVFILGTSGYTENIQSMKSLLIWFTLIYFIAGTYYTIQREKTSS